MNPSTEFINTISGGAELLAWFGGRMPSFHDSEVLGITLNRVDACAEIRIHGFEMTSEVDARGYYVCTRHAVFTFRLTEVTALELDGFNHQNALMGLALQDSKGEFRLEFDPAYGLGGFVQAQKMAISIEPGIPPGSTYDKSNASA